MQLELNEQEKEILKQLSDPDIAGIRLTQDDTPEFRAAIFSLEKRGILRREYVLSPMGRRAAKT